MNKNKRSFNIMSVEDYLDVGVSLEEVIELIEATPLEKFKPIYVTAYFLLKPDFVSS